MQSGSTSCMDKFKAMEIIREYEKSGETADKFVQFNLGVAFFVLGGPEDLKKAVYWFGNSADKGYDPAQYNFGCCYLNGTGVEIDFKKALEWFEKAAKQNHPSAQRNLALLHEQNGDKAKTMDEKICCKWKSKCSTIFGGEKYRL